MKTIILSSLFLFVSVIYCYSQSDGYLDINFGINGIVYNDFGYDNGIANDVAIQQNGKIILAGAVGMDPNLQYSVLARYKTTGILDSTFGVNGVVPINTSSNHVINSIIIQPDEKIISIGNNGQYGPDIELSRFNSDGSFDNTFGTNGTVVFDAGGEEMTSSAVLQSDGKIVVVGSTFISPKYRFFITRFNTNGSIDSTFNSNGILIQSLGSFHDFAYSTTLQSNGNILVAGKTETVSGGSLAKFAIVRYYTDGSIDSTFSDDGIVLLDNFASSYHYSSAQSIKIQADGKIVAAGETSSSNQNDFAIARLNGDGSLDTTFSGDGKLRIDWANTYDCVSELVFQPDEKIILVGSGSGNMFLVRINPDGTLDNSFSDDGKVFGIGYESSGLAAVLQQDLSIVVATRIEQNSNLSFGMVRFGHYNDDCTDAELLPVYNSTCGGASTGNVANATESISAIPCNGNTGYANDDVWFKFVATSTSHTIIVNSSTSFNAVVELLSGSCNGTSIACADLTGQGDDEIFTQSGLTPGNTYYIRVYDFNFGMPATTTFDICVIDPTTNIKEIELEDSFNIYPNPANYYITIEVNNKELSTVNIYDLMGKQLISENFNNQIKINTSDLTKGMYILKVETNNQLSERKIIIE